MSAALAGHLATLPAFVRRLIATAVPSLPWLGGPGATKKVDHACLRVGTQEEYERFKAEFDSAGASLLTETIVGGRLIATYKLKKVVVVQSPSGQYPIELDVIELPSPKPGRAYATGWEHIEIAICEDTDPASALVSPVEDLSAASMRVLEAFLAHPLNAGVPFDTTALGKGGFNLEVRFRAGDAGSIKFHWLPLETVVEIEKKELH